MIVEIALFAGFVLLLCSSAFFSSSETALFSLDLHEVNRMEESHPRAAKQLTFLLEEPTRLLSTILIGNTIINVQLWLLGAGLLGRLGLQNGMLKVAILTVITLIFGEFGPKRLALRSSVTMARLYAPILAFLVPLLKPFRTGLESMTQRFEHIFRPQGHIINEEEYDALVEAGGESGSLDDHEHVMVRSILNLEKQFVGDVMTPRVDMIGVDLSDSDEDLYETAKNSKTRFIVLYREQIDNIVGLLNVRQYLLDPRHRIHAATDRPFYIPEQCSLDKLLTQFLTKRERVAVVVDEYGGTAGMITRGDILDELTGDMDAEDPHSFIFEELPEGSWMVDGSMSLSDVNRQTGLELDSENADRLSGWILEQMESLPKVGDLVELPGVRARVKQMRRNRIILVHLEALELEEGA